MASASELSIAVHCRLKVVPYAEPEGEPCVTCGDRAFFQTSQLIAEVRVGNERPDTVIIAKPICQSCSQVMTDLIDP